MEDIADYWVFQSYAGSWNAASLTFVEAIHVQLPHERRYVCMLKVLPAEISNHSAILSHVRLTLRLLQSL